MVSQPPITAPHVRTTPYGQPALASLRDLVATAKRGDPLAPVTVVVAANSVGVASRRHLADGSLGPVAANQAGLAGVTFLTIYRLAELLGAADLAAHGRRPVSTPILTGAVRSVLRAEPGVFAAVAQHPTTERALVAAHRELSDLNRQALDTLARQSPRAADVVRIHLTVRASLSRQWYDEHDLVQSALAILDTHHPLIAQLGEVIVHLPQQVTRAQGHLLMAVAARRPTTLLVGVTGVPDADEPVRRTLSRFGSTIDHATPARPVPDQPPLPSVVSVSDPDEEVRHVVRGVVAAAREGVGLERMAIVWAVDDPYARLVHDHLVAAGIAFNGMAVARVSQRVFGRSLLQLLALSDRGIRRDDLFELLSAAPVRWQGRSAPSRVWEVLSRRAGVVSGADQWRERLTRLTADLETAKGRIGRGEDAEDAAFRVRRIDSELAHLAGLAAFVNRLSTDLDQADTLSSWEQFVRWCRRLATRYFGNEADRQQWPDIEQRAAEVVERALDRLAVLDAVDPCPDLAVFRRTLEAELDSGLGRIGRFGHGVLVGHLSMTMGLALDRVWVLGASEGQLPGRSRDDSLLPDRERATTGELTLRSSGVTDQHHQLLATMAACSGALTMLRSRGDLRVTTERVVSRWVPTDALSVELEVASHAAGIGRAGFPATQQDYDLRSLVEHRRHQPDLTGHPLVDLDTRFARGVQLVTSRRSAAFTRFDGNLGDAAPHSGSLTASDQIVSATRLETWAACPHRYLMRYLLGVEPIDRPEERLAIHPLDRGSLIHEVLEAFVQEAIERNGDRIPPTAAWSETDRRRLVELARGAFADLEAQGLTGVPLYWRRDQRQILADLLAFCDRDEVARGAERRGPIATELGFGFDDGQPPVVVELTDDRRLRVRGSIDRVDLADDGSLVVIDYKTGSAPPGGGADPTQRGTRLQLPLYALAARELCGTLLTPVVSRYWFISRKAKFAVRELELTSDAAERIDEVLRTICDGIDAGVFSPHPVFTTRQGYVECDYCDPDGLGVTHLVRTFARKARAPQLAGYVALAEPDLLTAPTPSLKASR